MEFFCCLLFFNELNNILFLVEGQLELYLNRVSGSE